MIIFNASYTVPANAPVRKSKFVIPGRPKAGPGTHEHGLQPRWHWSVFLLGWTAPDGIECAKLWVVTTLAKGAAR